MPPKTPSELREQLERENAEPTGKGKSRTAEGMEVPDPKRRDFLGNLRKVSEPEQK
jgi:hypothetical protein